MLDNLRGRADDVTSDDKIPLVILKLEASLKKLDVISETLKREDNQLFERCVEARLEGDNIHAMMYANECAEIRKIALHVVSSKYALEQMVLRLHTVTKLGNILVTVTPVVDVIKETQNRLVGIVPSIANNLNDANKILVDSLSKMGTSDLRTATQKPLVYSSGAEKVLEEAKAAAEDTIREKFPKIPRTLKDIVKQESEILTN
jgi:division protein CdvB (Snf7/Vps24/ESCRT-III family)